jgi:alpha-beta hydrolase superfamily lysophospholipase
MEGNMTEEMFEGKGGLKLFARSWRPSRTPRGVVVINHGFKSHSGLYTWVAERLVERNIAVYALDMRGHGKSEGERYYVDRFDDYVADLETFIANVKQREPGLPVFLVGHSAGGVVACSYALEHQDQISGLVCESFAHEVPAPDFALSLLKGLSHVVPHAHVLKLKEEDFSRDPKFVATMKNEPLVNHMPGPTKTVAEMVRADERLRKEFGKITVPVMILHGTADKATRPSGSQKFFDRTGSKDKTLKLYEGHYHDLLNDIGKDVVMADVTEWITTRLPLPVQ